MITKGFEEQISDSYEKTVVEIADLTMDYHKPERKAKGVAFMENPITSLLFEYDTNEMDGIAEALEVNKAYVKSQATSLFDIRPIKELPVFTAIDTAREFSIDPVEEKEYYKASFDQTRLFTESQAEGISTTYNLQEVHKIEGKIDRQSLEAVFQKLIKRHETLRTSFKMVEGEVFQVIQKNVDFHIQYIDAEEALKNNSDNFNRIVKNFIKPFDFSKAPLMRVALVKEKENSHLLLLDIHHLIADGPSIRILEKDFYQLLAGEQLPELKLRNRDYSEWENRQFYSCQLIHQEEYWLNQYKGEIPILNLSARYPQPAVREFERNIVFFKFGKEITQRLQQLVKERGATLDIVLLTMYIILLHKYSHQQDIVISLVVAGRDHPDLENMVGFFAKTLPLRNYPIADKTFESFLKEVKENTLNALDNQQYPFSQLVKKLPFKKNLGRNPFFNAAFMSEDMDIITPLSPGKSKNTNMSSRLLGAESKTAEFDFTFKAIEHNDNIFCKLKYNNKLFKRNFIKLMKERFLRLVRCILNDSTKKIRELDYIIPLEMEMRKFRSVEFNL